MCSVLHYQQQDLCDELGAKIVSRHNVFADAYEPRQQATWAAIAWLVIIFIVTAGNYVTFRF